MNYLKKNKKSFSLFPKLLLLLFLFFAEFSFAQQQWYSTYVPRNRHVNSLKFLSHDDILFGGGNEFNASLEDIWLSRDKGMEWENVNNTNGAPWIKSMAFIDTMQGYAVGDSATILKTVNGAHFWTLLPKPIQNREFSKIIYVTPKILFIVGGSIPYPEIIIGGGHVDTIQTIVKSTDGGNTWTVMLDRKGFWLNGISFTDSLHGVAVGDKGNILKTVDGGANWTTIAPPVVRNFNAVKFISSTVGYIVGGINHKDPFTLVYIDSLSTILRTNDGGASWSVLKDDLNGILNDITFSSDSIGYIVGDKATLLKTTTAGLNWTPVTVPGAANDQTFNCVEFKNDHLGMIGCRDGYLHVYTTSALADAYTFGAKYVDSTTVTMFGGVKTNGDIATYAFLISLDSTFTNYSNVFEHPDDVLSDLNVALLQSDLSNILPPHTTFYYTLHARTLAGGTNGDTLSFTIEEPKYIFQSLPATDVSTLAITMNGIVSKFPTGVTLSFEYGTSPLLENEIAAVPSNINDTLQHAVTAVLNGLLPNTTYYFRLKGVHNGQSYFGDLLAASTLNPLQVVPASSVTLSGVILNGTINGLGTSADISFEYGKTLSFGNEIIATPATINDTLYHNVNAGINGLESNTTYYFRLKAVHNSQPFYSSPLSFKTISPYLTLSATNVTSTGATLNGFINHSPSTPARISFEYDTSLNFGNAITAIDSIVNDTLPHDVYAVLNGLQNNHTYYFRLKGVHGSDIYYGDVKTFFTGTLYKTFQTLPATNVLDSFATLNGGVDKFQVPVSLSFEYGTSAGQLIFETAAFPSYINDTLPYTVTANISGLLPNTQYYFRLKGHTSLTDFFGDIFVFQTGLSYALFNTLQATNITNTSAQLNGRASHLSNPVTLSFEWGPTPSLGNTISSIPGSISDTALHNISGTLGGLQQDKIFFYRLKAISNGTPYYGDTKQFFTGGSEIPNWDFQYWNYDTMTFATYWNSLGKGGFQHVPGHSGNYALQLFSQTFMMNGAIGDGLFGGAPVSFSTPPDSIVVYANYNIDPADTAGMLIALFKNGQLIDTTSCPIIGSSGGVFQRKAYKIQYDHLDVPDTIIILLLNTNFVYLFTEHQSPFFNNILTVDDISFQPGNITFRNSGFEDWFTSIFESPASWYTFNYMGKDPDHPETRMTSKVYFDPPSDYALELNNIPWYGQNFIMNGELSNVLNNNTYEGFPVKGKHVTLNGYYKYFPANHDSMRILIKMIKNNILIGEGTLSQTDSVTEFTPFSIPINYQLPGIPEIANINIRCYNPQLGSRTVVDKLSFDGFVTTGVKPPAEVLELDGMKVYPNPARDLLIIENLLSENKECSLSLINISGLLLKEIKLPPGQHISQMEVDDLSPGFYVLMMKKGDKIYTKKIVIQ